MFATLSDLSSHGDTYFQPPFWVTLYCSSGCSGYVPGESSWARRGWSGREAGSLACVELMEGLSLAVWGGFICMCGSWLAGTRLSAASKPAWVHSHRVYVSKRAKETWVALGTVIMSFLLHSINQSKSFKGWKNWISTWPKYCRNGSC